MKPTVSPTLAVTLKNATFDVPPMEVTLRCDLQDSGAPNRLVPTRKCRPNIGRPISIYASFPSILLPFNSADVAHAARFVRTRPAALIGRQQVAIAVSAAVRVAS